MNSLTPFDHDMINMIEKTLNAKIYAYQKMDKVGISFNSRNDKEETIQAVVEAVKGRLGSRFISFEKNEDSCTLLFGYSEESFPEQFRFDLKKPDLTVSNRYIEKTKFDVRAIQFTEVSVNMLIDFTGGGSLTFMKEGSQQKPVSYEFPDQDGHFKTVNITDYVAEQNGVFKVYSEKDFLNKYNIQ